jgi:hypothetical protein
MKGRQRERERERERERNKKIRKDGKRRKNSSLI